MRAITGFMVSMLLGIATVRAETITIPSFVEYAPGVDVTAAVRDECALQTKLPEWIVKYAKGMDIVMHEGNLDDVTGRVLRMEYTDVLGFGGGAWSGAKYATVTGELFEDGQLIGSFVAARMSGGGAFGGFKGTCSILGRCVKVLGKDIARFLKNPVEGAKLGDAGRFYR